MAEQNQEKLSNQIKVSIDHGIPMIDHSDAYNDLQDRALGGERFTKHQRHENLKFIEAEEAQLALAHKDPVAFLKQQALAQQGKGDVIEVQPLQVDAKHPSSNTYPAETTPVAKEATIQASPEQIALAKAQQEHNKFIQDYEKAYAAAHPNDQKDADENVQGLMKMMKDRGATNQEIATAGNQAMRDQHKNLVEQTENRKINTLTPSVDNYAPAAGVSRADISAASSTSKIEPGYTATINHGFDADRYGLTRLAAQGSASVSNEGKLQNAEMSFTAVKALPKSMQPDGTTLFVAGGAGVKATPNGLDGDVTLLGVAASNIKGVPVGAYAGASYDVKTENAAAVAKVEAMINANTNHSTTFGIAGAHNFGGKQNESSSDHKGEVAENNSVTISAYQKYNQFYAQLTATHTTEGTYGNGEKSQADNSVGLTAGIQF